MTHPYGRSFRPTRARGQNFLSGRAAIEAVLDAIAPKPEDDFVEIGAGSGELTLPLAARSRRVLAVEADPFLYEKLGRGIAKLPRPNVDPLYADFLKVDLAEQLTARRLEQVRVVGNLPYRVASPILLRLLPLRHLFIDLTLMFQKEVADRLAARPGTKAYGFLSVVTQQAVSVQTVLTLPPRAFRPRPKVWSSLVRLHPNPGDERRISDPEVFAAVVKGLLAYRRKTIGNNLRAMESGEALKDGLRRGLAALGVGLDRRAETLTVEEFVALSHFCASTL